MLSSYGQDPRCKVCGRAESVLSSLNIMYHIPTDTCYACIKNPKPAEVRKVPPVVVPEGCGHTQPDRVRACADGTCPICMRVEILQLRERVKQLEGPV